MRAYLEAQGFDEVVTLLDEQVTPEAFRQPQRYLKAKMTANDRFLFYYSGHGITDAQFNALMILWDYRARALKQHELAELLVVNRASAGGVMTSPSPTMTATGTWSLGRRSV